MSRYTPRATDPVIQVLQKKKRGKKPWERDQQKLTDLELTDQFFKNVHGCYRWQFIRSAYFNDFIDIDRVVDLSKKWRDQNEYLWLEAIDTTIPDNENNVVGNLFFKCAKRGNDVYKNRLKERFSFLDSLEPIYYFLDTDPKKYTPMVFLTFTVDPKKYTKDQAWDKISEELHLFESKLRQAYSGFKCSKCGNTWIGKKKCPRCVKNFGSKKVALKDNIRTGSFVKFRVWESHESGYPHCHVVYYFHDKWFKSFKHKDKYRIVTKHKNKISKFWRMGNVDIQAVQDTHGAFKEVKKYITKNIWNKKGDLTNALICLYRKQMYSLSKCDPFKKRFQYWEKNNITNWRDQERTFMSKLDTWSKKDFIGSVWGTQVYFQFYNESGNLAEPGAATLVREFVHNCNIDNIEFRFVGCVAAHDIKDFKPDLQNEWVLCADPPPEFKYIVGFDSELYSFEKV